MDYAINENTYIKYQPTWIPTILFGFPADSGADLNELTLKLISKVNRSDDVSLRDQTQLMEEIMSVYTTSYMSNESYEGALSHTDGKTKFIAGPNNQIAFTMIDVIQGSEKLKRISNSLAGLVLDNKLNRYPPDDFSEVEKEIFSQDESLTKAFISFKTASPEDLTLEEINTMTGNNEMVTNVILRGQEVGLERVIEILETRQRVTSSKVECLDAHGIKPFLENDSENETCESYNILWKESNEVLNLKATNSLDEMAKFYAGRIKLMPRLENLK